MATGFDQSSGSAGRAESVSLRKLEGGIQLLQMKRPGSGVTSLQIWIGAGSCMEMSHPGSGMAHFLEHMVFKGTARRSALEINREAEKLGGFLNAYTSYDCTVYHIDLPAENAASGLDLLADFVWDPTLPEEGFAPEKEVILREIAMDQDDPDSHLFDSIMAAAYRDDFLQFPVIGIEERFRELESKDLSRFHREHYRSNDVLLLLAGEFSEGLIEKVESMVPQTTGQSTGPVAERESPSPVRLRLSGNWEGGRGLVMFQVRSGSLEDVLGLEWVMEVLAGGESSHLNRLIRLEKGLVHFFDGFCYPVGDVSLFGFSWLAESGHLKEAEEVLLAELDRVGRQGVPEEYLEKGKRRLRFERMRRKESVDGWASLGGEWFRSFGRVPDPEEENRILSSFGKNDFERMVSEQLSSSRAMAGQLFPAIE